MPHQATVRSVGLNILRVAVSGGLLYWVLRTAGLHSLVEIARQAKPSWLGVAYALAVLGIFIRAVRWRELMRAVGVHAPYGRLVYLYFIGQFFSSFLPTGFAGDAVRVAEAGGDVEKAKATGTVIVDRLTGFISLFLLAFIALPFAWREVPAALAWGIGLASAAILLGSGLLFEGRWVRRLTVWLPKPLSLSSDGFVGRTYSTVLACGGRAVAKAIAISTVFNLTQLAAGYCIALALGVAVSPGELFLMIPIAAVALLIPISISGLGVREQILVTLLSRLPAAQVTAFSLGLYSLDLCNALAGGGLYLLRGLLGLRGKLT